MLENVLSYKKCEDKNIEKILNIFRTQFQTSSRWNLERIEIKKIIPLCKHVYDERLKFAQISISNCFQNNIPLFYPYTVHYNNGDTQLIVPPIVEEREQKLYLGDGMHRIYSLLELNIKSAIVLVTHDCILPLPGKPQVWDNVKRVQTQLPCRLNFENYLEVGLTGYSKFCNGEKFHQYVE